jgi:ClpX C4-type zinc finger
MASNNADWRVNMLGSKRRMACSFCGKPDSDVAKLVAGPVRILRRVYICDACVGIAVRLMADDQAADVSRQPAGDGRQPMADGGLTGTKDGGARRVAFA